MARLTLIPILSLSYYYLTFSFPFRCAAPAPAAKPKQNNVRPVTGAVIVFGRPLPGLLACYSAFCLLCCPAKLASSGGRNGIFISKNGAHWEYPQ
jgi:hypothetical protein